MGWMGIIERIYCLVVLTCFNNLEKWWSSSMGLGLFHNIPYMKWKITTCSKPPTGYTMVEPPVQASHDSHVLDCQTFKTHRINTCYAQDSNCGKSKPLANLFGHVLQQRQHCGKKSQGSPVTRQVNRFNSMRNKGFIRLLDVFGGICSITGKGLLCKFWINMRCWFLVQWVSAMPKKRFKPWVKGPHFLRGSRLYNGCSNPPKKDGSWLSDVIMKLHHPLQQSY